MENASKALLISGGILIAIVILAISTRLFKSASNVSKSYFEQQEASEIAQFNANFSKFTSAGVQDENGKVTKQYATIYDIISLANFAYNYNSENIDSPNDPTTYRDDKNSVAIKIDLVINIDKNKNITYEDIESEEYLKNKYNKKTYTDLLKEYYYKVNGPTTADNYYTFEAETSRNNTGRINYVKFTQFN